MSGSIRDIMRDKPAKQLPPIPTDQKAKRFSVPVDAAEESCDDSYEADSCAVTVAVRMRPFATREVSDPRNMRVVSMEGCETIVKPSEGSSAHTFQYDYSFNSFDPMSPGYSSQQKVYESLAQPLLHRAFQGYNTCLFAYGQTGSGKSYSIMGHGSDDGIIPRFGEELFQKIEGLKENTNDVTAVNVETSFFEIYNEKIHDLLALGKGAQVSKQNLRVREHPDTGPYVEGLSTYPVASFNDVLKLLTLGNKQRATASTGMNDKSSRSHSVFTLHITQIKSMDFEETQHEHSVISKVNLVDLAGSERQSSAQTSGQRLKEGASINKSLLTLGKVISVLADQSSQAKKRKLFVPYRDSVLTWLLRESLGGNARTAMIATISPSSLNLEETLSTLRYAQQARSIVNLAKVNEDPKARLIRELRAEIDRLRAEQGGQGGGDDISTMQDILDLRKALQAKDHDMEIQQKDWHQKLKQAEEKMRQESSFLEHTGIAASSVNNKLPNLVNLNEDPQLSEILLYVLHEGQTKVGRQGTTKHKCDIQLSGALVADYHCTLLNDAGQVSITPIDKEAPTFVNGQQITHSITLNHGDRVIIGGDHYFRYNHPGSVGSSITGGNKRGSSGAPKDFQFAKAEIERAQNERLESERLKVQREMEIQMAEQLEHVETTYNQKLLDQKAVYENQLRRIQTDLLRQKTQSPVKVESANTTMPSAERLISSLRAEKLKLTESHARLKPKLKSAKQELAVKSIASVPTERGKTDLYKVALLIREGNKLSQLKSMPTEEVDNVIVIRVTDSELDRYTYLTIAKFEERLADMRESLENNESHDESVVAFCNPSDSWKNTDGAQSQPSLDEILNNENKLTPMEQVINSPVDKLHQSSQGSSRVKRSSPMCSTSLYNMCKDFVSYSLQKHKATNTGARRIFDSILRQCELCRIAVTSVVSRTTTHTRHGHRDGASTSRTTDDCDEMVGACCLQLISSSEVLLEQCQLCSSMCEDIDSPHISQTVRRMSELSFKISRLIIQLMQALHSGMEKSIHDNSTSMITSLLELCKMCGIMSLTTDTTISMQSNTFLQLSVEVQSACSRGSLEQCVHTTNDKLSLTTQSISYMINGSRTSFADESIYGAVLKVVREVERFLTQYRDEASNTLNLLDSKPDADPCHRYDVCSQAVINLNTIGDSMGALSKPMFTQGREYDRAIMLKAADTIKRCCRKLASDTSQLDLTPLVGAVSLLFTVTEAEGKVKVRHKSQSQSVSDSPRSTSSTHSTTNSPAASNRVKRILPQVSTNTEKIQRRVLPPSPETTPATMTSFVTSPPKTVSKLTAMFEPVNSREGK